MNIWKIVMAITLVSVSYAGSALGAGNPDTGPGCGLGKKLWEDWKGQKQIVPQAFMASTNMTGSYSFAISSGTSGCSHDGKIWDSERASLFIEINYASLAEDIARGGGEHLTSLASLLHVPQEDRPEFFAMTQQEYHTFVRTGEQSLLEWLQFVRDAKVPHQVLATFSVER
jgi:hypothetical protein